MLLEVAKVAIVPGEAFGAPGYARLCFALGDDDLGEGVRRIADLLVVNLDLVWPSLRADRQGDGRCCRMSSPLSRLLRSARRRRRRCDRPLRLERHPAEHGRGRRRRRNGSADGAGATVAGPVGVIVIDGGSLISRARALPSVVARCRRMLQQQRRRLRRSHLRPMQDACLAAAIRSRAPLGAPPRWLLRGHRSSRSKAISESLRTRGRPLRREGHRDRARLHRDAVRRERPRPPRRARSVRGAREDLGGRAVGAQRRAGRARSRARRVGDRRRASSRTARSCASRSAPTPRWSPPHARA